MACNDCYQNCGGNVTSDKCVKYTGPDVDFLGLETGDQLSQVEAALIEHLEKALDGTGVTFEELLLCTDIKTALDGAEANLSNIVQAISDVVCELKESITELETEVDPPALFTTPCLTLPTNPSRDQILQAVITKLCSINTTVTSISTNYVTLDTVCQIVQDCIEDQNEGTPQEYQKMPKYVALPYHGPLSVFDSQGKGLSSAGYEKIYICNGQSVGTFLTPDYRGRSPIGVNIGLPGAALDAAVDPAVAANAGYGFSQGTKKGSYTDVLAIAQLPAHSLSTPAASVPLNIPGQRGGDNSDHSNMTAFAAGDKAASETSFNFTLNTSINIPAGNTNSIGSNSPHNSTQPVIGAVFIIYVP